MADQATSRGDAGALLSGRLRDAVRRGGQVGAGRIVLLGDPAVTEPAADAALAPLPAPWQRVWRPASPEELLAGLRVSGGVEAWTVVRLGDLRRYLLRADEVLGADVASALRAALLPPSASSALAGGPLLVVATMPADPDRWRAMTQPPASGGQDRWTQARALLQGATVLTAPASVPPRTPPPPMPVAVTLPVALATPAVPPTITVAPSLMAPAPAAPAPAAPAPTGPAPTGPYAEAVVVVRGEADVEAAPVAAPWAAAAEPDDATTERAAPVEALDTAEASEPPEASESTDAGEAAVTAITGASSRERRPRPTDGARPPCPRWGPSAVSGSGAAEEPAASLRDRAAAMERAGQREGADRLYEQAAHRGDVIALARLAALRGYRESPTTSNDPDADRMFEAAAAEGNTAVLFGLAGAGHGRALRLLARLREDASWPWR